MMTKTKVINLFGGPGAGKSTVATGLFSKLKQARRECEYVSEYAKEITWEGTQALLSNQTHVFSEQFRRQFRLLGKVEFIVTDSPLLLSAVYFNKYARKSEFFDDYYLDISETFFIQSFHQFDNLNFLIKREKPYSPNGRNQTLEQAIEIDEEVQTMLRDTSPYTTVKGPEGEIIDTILRTLI